MERERGRMIFGWLFRRRTFGVKRHRDWGKVRKEFLKTHDQCAVCGTKKKLAVHHIKPVHLFPELELELSNLITLCQSRSHNDHFIFGHLLDWCDYNDKIIDDSKYYYDRLCD